MPWSNVQHALYFFKVEDKSMKAVSYVINNQDVLKIHW
ncbi:hypothetical protein MGSAQ_000488 [marine sediment metagenome]|uniref:Uncharacterized protein n=1 Tax=marine sediment metagenome TaxID=412755 RepID=A0A1B6NX34_9ZZZZ